MSAPEIPEDIMDIAFGLTAGDWDQPHDVRAKKVAGAILSERERCVRVAYGAPLCKLSYTTITSPAMMFEAGASAQQRVIAKLICNPTHPHSSQIAVSSADHAKTELTARSGEKSAATKKTSAREQGLHIGGEAE